MKLNFNDYEALIIDLGGVILNIDYQCTIEAFQKLNIPDFEKLYAQAKQNYIFDQLECGQITPEFFRNYIRDISQTQLNDTLIDEAWNAMLLDLPSQRLEMLERWSKNKPLYLLSNTNAIHYEWFQHYLERNHRGINAFENLFKKVYYSHSLGDRKPNMSCFDKVCTQNQITKDKTLFIDDSSQHIAGAQKAGLNTLHMSNLELKEIFH